MTDLVVSEHSDVSDEECLLEVQDEVGSSEGQL